MQRMKVGVVAFDQKKGAAVVALVNESGEKKLPLLVGISEALAIFRELNRTPSPRPMTYDLFMSFLDGVRARVTKVVVDAIREDTYLAWVHFQVGDTSVISDSRPSDGIVLALKFQAPIYVEDKVLERAEKVGLTIREVSEEAEAEDLKEWLDEVKPSDFEEDEEEED